MSKSKPWTKPARGRSPEGTRLRRRVLIYCEDTKSSADYLRCFPVDKKRVEVRVVGTGMNTDSLVKAAIDAKEKARKERTPYSQIWCVFDRDSFPLKNYVLAFDLAESNTISLAWTNEAFELWYLLHFDYVDSALSRRDYAKKLATRGVPYDKTDRAFYEKLKDRQDIAVVNAKKLERFWNEKGCRYPERENPSTNIHTLVEFLNEFVDLASVDRTP